MEIVMVLAIVGGMVFMMKVSAKEDNSNKTLPDNDNGGEGERKSK